MEENHADLSALVIDKSARPSRAPDKRRRTPLIIAAVLILVAAVAVVVYRTFVSAVPVVQVVQPVIEGSNASAPVLTATGYIVPRHKINVGSKVAGRIAWVGVEKGDKVKEGQALVRLEDAEFRAATEQAKGTVMAAEARLAALEAGSRPQEIEQALHNLEEGKANLANAKLNLERAQKLFSQEAVAQKQLDDARTQFNVVQQQVNSLEKTYELLKLGPRKEEIERGRGELVAARGQLAYAQALLAATEIRAPVTGTVLERTAEKGEMVAAQFATGAEAAPRASVIALADLSDLRVELDISQSDFARLGDKQRGVVTVDAFPGRTYDGAIAEMSPMANRQKATVQVKVGILNPDDYLRPEMSAKVAFLPKEAGDGTRAVILPPGTVHEREGRKIALVVNDGRIHFKEIKVVGKRPSGQMVDGLAGRENVVLNAPADLKEGDRVKIKTKY